MSYLSFAFCAFLLALFILYYLAGRILKKYQYLLLLLGSCAFVCWSNWLYGVYLLASVAISYSCGIFTVYYLRRERELRGDKAFSFLHLRERKTAWAGKNSRFFLVLSICFNVGFLAITKYFNWLGQSVFSLLGKAGSFSSVNWIIPIGLSFYTFTLIGYNVDLYTGVCRPEKNFFKFALFVSFFPKLLEGPIMQYDKLRTSGLFDTKTIKDVDFAPAFQRIIIGLFKKVLIADILGVYIDFAWDNFSSLPGYSLLLCVFLYSVQIYCDFSGFIDMSIGIAGLFGVKLDENFRSPYLSKTISEFWRRWHISLGEWLKKYIYIPLGGNRVSKWRWVINVGVVWLISGLWHGASFNFVLWGLYFAVLLAFSGLVKPLIEKNDLLTKLSHFLDFFANA